MLALGNRESVDAMEEYEDGQDGSHVGQRQELAQHTGMNGQGRLTQVSMAMVLNALAASIFLMI